MVCNNCRIASQTYADRLRAFDPSYPDPSFANIANQAFSNPCAHQLDGGGTCKKCGAYIGEYNPNYVHIRANQRNAPFPEQETEQSFQEYRLRKAAETITEAAVRIGKAATDLQIKTDPDIPTRWKDRWS